MRLCVVCLWISNLEAWLNAETRPSGAKRFPVSWFKTRQKYEKDVMHVRKDHIPLLTVYVEHIRPVFAARYDPLKLPAKMAGRTRRRILNPKPDCFWMRRVCDSNALTLYRISAKNCWASTLPSRRGGKLSRVKGTPNALRKRGTLSLAVIHITPKRRRNITLFWTSIAIWISRWPPLIGWKETIACLPPRTMWQR